MADNRVVLVTGANGALGAAIAKRFHQAGCRMVLFDRDEDAATAAGARFSDRAIALPVDQTDRAQVERGIAAAVEHFGGVDVLVANAGYARFGGFLEMEPRIWDRHVGVNLSGTFHVCQAVARVMAERRKGGAIVVVSSSLALSHADRTGAYCVTKAALLMLVRTMAAELGVHRIRANAVLPGVVESAMTGFMLDQPGVRDDLLQQTPAGRLGSPEDIADAVEFLCSDRADFITGALLAVDGGQSIYGQPRWVRQDRTTPFETRWLAGLGELDVNG